jgi:ribosome-associated translation inhibitor RaiA
MESKINFTGDFSRVNDEEKAFINERLQKFIDRYDLTFNEIVIKLDCRLHKESSRGRKAHYCRINIFSDKGKFHADNQDFGAENAITGALGKIERQINNE